VSREPRLDWSRENTLDGRLLLDRVPEPLREDRPDILGEIEIHRAGRHTVYDGTLASKTAPMAACHGGAFGHLDVGRLRSRP